MWRQGLIYQGHRIVPYCIRCGTGLSSHELGQPGVYQNRTDRSAFVAMPLRDGPSAGSDGTEALVVWTTTPWTLPGNAAVAVHPEATYGYYPVEGRTLIMAVDLAAGVIGTVEPRRTVPGSDLVGASYSRPYGDVGPDLAGRVIAWPEVSLEIGSGLVHIAPAFGEEDAALGARENVPVINPVDGEGRLTHGKFAGLTVFDAVAPILDDLAARGLLVRVADLEHSYPHCWRCGTPLIYWAKPGWFIATARRKADLVRENDRIRWYPDTIKEGRFGNWLRGNVDWAISRDRYWGTPLPIWRCAAGHDTCVGSRAELARLSGRDVGGVGLHRPETDQIAISCPDCGEAAARVPEVTDVWFDSGCVPAAQWGYPALGTRDFEAEPVADFICEAIDQTRGWFYSLLAVNTLVFGRSPYRNVVCLGHLVDDEGRKMSKSLGNVIEPNALFDQFGADGVRWYLYTTGQPWGSRSVSRAAIGHRVARDLDTLWNVLSFYRQYAEIEKFEPSAAPVPSAHVLDRWIRSRLAAVIEEATAALEGYQAHQGAQALSAFVDDLSNWYVRRARRRFWGADPGAFQTLHDVLGALARLLAPFCPHLAEAMYQALARPAVIDSVHLADWPVPGERDEPIEAEMATAREVVALVRAVRAQAGLPVRQPLRGAVVSGIPPFSPEVERIVTDETNIAAIEVGGSTVPVTYHVLVNWKQVGPKYRHVAQEIKGAVSSAGTEFVERVRSGQPVSLAVADEEIVLEPGDLTIRESIESGWAAKSQGELIVAIDTTLDDELRAEYRRRNAIREIQVARREAGFAVSDRIVLWLAEELWDARDRIAREVLAAEVRPLSDGLRSPSGESAGEATWRTDYAAFRRL
jgi:isoleucyl-tRNA synthetase